MTFSEELDKWLADHSIVLTSEARESLCKVISYHQPVLDADDVNNAYIHHFYPMQQFNDAVNAMTEALNEKLIAKAKADAPVEPGAA